MKEDNRDQKRFIANLLRFVFIFILIVTAVFSVHYSGILSFETLGKSEGPESIGKMPTETTETTESRTQATSDTAETTSSSTTEDASPEDTTEDTTTKYPPATLPSFETTTKQTTSKTETSQTQTSETTTETDSTVFPNDPEKIKAEDITAEKMKELIVKDLLSIRKRSRPGYKLWSVKNIVVHYVANPGSTAKNNRDYFNTQTKTYVSAHFIIDMDGTIIQCIPTDEVAYANGTTESNYTSISIECCHPDNTGKFTEETYISLVKLVSFLCNEYGLDADDVQRHHDITGKDCPRYFVKNKDEWQNFKDDLLILD